MTASQLRVDEELTVVGPEIGFSSWAKDDVFAVDGSPGLSVFAAGLGRATGGAIAFFPMPTKGGSGTAGARFKRPFPTRLGGPAIGLML